MRVKKGGHVAPPPVGDEWDVRHGNTEAKRGWDELGRQVPTNTRRAYEAMRSDPLRTSADPSFPHERQHQLRGNQSHREVNGKSLPQWQIEVTSGGRITYLVDEENHRIYLVGASTGHPKFTE